MGVEPTTYALRVRSQIVLAESGQIDQWLYLEERLRGAAKQQVEPAENGTEVWDKPRVTVSVVSPERVKDQCPDLTPP